jgi:hypothetical protein
MVHTKFVRQRKALSLMSVILLFALLLSACGNPQTQQSATQNKAELDKAMAHAQSIGVPDSMLRPILNQENALSGTHEPFSLFSSQPATNYHANLSQNYEILTTQVKGLEDQATQQIGSQASQSLKDFQAMVSMRQSQGFVEAKTFAVQLQQVETQMNKANTPGQYMQVDKAAQQSTEALDLMGTTNDQLNGLRNQITTLKSSKLDTSALEVDVQNDVQNFRKATTVSDFNTISQQLNAQLQTANALSTLAIPYVGQVKLSQFQDQINKMKSYGGDTTTYQKEYDTDKSLMDSNNFVKFSSQIDQDLAGIQTPVLQLQANHDINALINETKAWGHTHQYHDDWNGQDYDQAYEYWNGRLWDIQNKDIPDAVTADDFQTIITTIQQQKTLFHAEEADQNDHTPQNQPHQSDLNLMKTLGVSNDKVIVTSLINGSMRVYQGGKLIHETAIVSGNPDKPSPPGFTQIYNRQSPAIFKAFDQNKNSPFYYPDTPINYAMEYHVGEYYYHDSWWRTDDDYGYGKKYPHYAPAAFNDGTHGCINMSKDEAAWLWNFTQSVDANNSVPVYSIVY